MKWLRSLLRGRAKSSWPTTRLQRQTARCRPAIEPLEERLQPSASVIQSNFNGTAIAAGSTVWFNSVLKVSGLGAAPVTLDVANGEIDFTANGTAYAVAVPDATITFTPGGTAATTTFNAGSNTWVTSVPSNEGGNVFLAGVALPTPAGLPGGINPVSWHADFSSATAGLTVNWQWAAAVYKSFGTDYAALGVKPVDSNSLSQYANSDHAGTPEDFKSFVTGGSRGGGGSNFTGSYSATGHVSPDQSATASLSGTVYDASGHPVVTGVVVTLTTTNSQGQTLTFTTTTDMSGSYSFSGLPTDTFTVTYTDSTNGVSGTATVDLGPGNNTFNIYEPLNAGT
jgi:hypothetical protein